MFRYIPPLAVCGAGSPCSLTQPCGRSSSGPPAHAAWGQHLLGGLPSSNGIPLHPTSYSSRRRCQELALCWGSARTPWAILRGWYVCRDKGWRAGASGPEKSTCPLSCSQLHRNSAPRDMGPRGRHPSARRREEEGGEGAGGIAGFLPKFGERPCYTREDF